LQAPSAGAFDISVKFLVSHVHFGIDEGGRARENEKRPGEEGKGFDNFLLCYNTSP
jgi:hypothetical protein